MAGRRNYDSELCNIHVAAAFIRRRSVIYDLIDFVVIERVRFFVDGEELDALFEKLQVDRARICEEKNERKILWLTRPKVSFRF